MSSLPSGFLSKKGPAFHGVTGALFDLELQRIELVKFNLFDNTGTWQTYINGRDNVGGPALKTWPEMRLPKNDPNYAEVGGDAPQQVCKGDLVRARSITGICNDVLNPLMGSSGMPMARNVEFETTFPDRGLNTLTRNRHGDRLSLLVPDPQVISRQIVYARTIEPRSVQFGIRLARQFAGCELRLPEGAVLQCACRLLDPVHDARLVFAHGRRP